MIKMIKESFKNDVISAIIDNSAYRHEDFIFKVQDILGNFNLIESTLFDIQYKFDDTYYYKITIPNKRIKSTLGMSDYSFDVKCCPGEILSVEESSYQNKEELISEIKIWTSSFTKELLQTGINRILNIELTKQEEQLAQFESKIKNMDEEYMSKEEGIELREKLDELELKFKEQYESETKMTTEHKKELEKIVTEITVLKSTVEIMKKKKWYSMLFSKMLIWSIDPKNKNVIGAASEIVKLALPPELKSIIPDSKNITAN